MSIGKTQANALATGFVDDIGAGKDAFQPEESISTLLMLAGELIDLAQKNLEASNSNASGKLSESIQAEEPVTGSGFIQQDISMNFYGQYINSGVRGSKGGSGLYAFKNDFISNKMIAAFQTYITTARSKIGTERLAPGKNESKNIATAQKQSAAAMARATKQHGIKATYFMDKAIDQIDEVIQERFGEALRIDVINALPDSI